jgi:Spy/CpxP family protein refolding chaperone
MIAALVVLLSPAIALAQTHASAYAGEQTRSIKSLTDSDIAALIDGQGAGFAKAAELNGYPGPAHALELRGQLSLSTEQITASEALMTEHKRRARELGTSLVDAERRLDALFAHRQADPARIDQAAREVGLLQARLRAEHLNTHLAQTALLNAEQVLTYNRLRGYTPAGSDAASHQHRQ